MLRENFIASVGVPTKPPDTSVTKDAAIFIYEYQPLAAQRAMFKKSATPQNCLAISNEHIFAAQSGKAVVHVYSREKGNQEAIVPFTDRVTSIALACDDSVLILGTVEGRLFLWETCTGRQVVTSQTHLQAITSIAVDPSSNFLLSASKDATVQVWSIPDLLSFTTSDAQSSTSKHTFNSHQSEVTALAIGHSASTVNFAISAAKDRTCFLWDYRKNTLLRTFLLPSIPTCVTLDPADRVAYVGYEDGNLQMLDLLVSPSGSFDALQNGLDPTVPIQPPASSIWKLPEDSHRSVLSISVSFDGTTVISGHESGSILSWDVGRRSFASIRTTTPLPGPVTNLHFLPVTGFAGKSDRKRHIQIPAVTKPKFGAFDNSNNGFGIPGNYAFNVCFDEELQKDEQDPRHPSFESILSSPTFPTDLLDEGLCELAAWSQGPREQASGRSEEISEDFMALDDGALPSEKSLVEEENASLRMQLAALRRVQSTSFAKIEQLIQERNALRSREPTRLANGLATRRNDEAHGQDSDESSDIEIE